MTAARLPLVERADGRTARRAASQERILSAAADLFAERGYGSTTMDDVALAAGVSKGTIFYNYDSKADLCAKVIVASAEDLEQVIERARVGLRGWNALETLTLTVMRHIDAAPARAQFLTTELFRPNRPWAAQLPGVRDRLIRPLVAVLLEVAEERKAAGLTAEAANPNASAVAVSLLGALVTAALDRRAFPGRTLEEVHAGLLTAISGLRPPAA